MKLILAQFKLDTPVSLILCLDKKLIKVVNHNDFMGFL